jgi:hypothetical protein
MTKVVTMYNNTWQVGHKSPELEQSVNVIFKGLVGNARNGGVGLGTTKLLLGNRLSSNSLSKK